MSGVVDDMQFGLNPGLMELPGIFQRADHIIASVNDDTTDALQASGIAENLIVLEKAVVDKVMVFDTCQTQRRKRIGKVIDNGRCRFQRQCDGAGSVRQCRRQRG